MAGDTQQLAAADAAATVKVLDAVDRTAWDAYLSALGGGHLFHCTAWDRVFDVYNLRVMRLAALRGGRIVGVLPLLWQRSLLFGNRLVALPWFDAAGVLAADEQVRGRLIDRAGEIAEDRGIAELQLRQREPIDVAAEPRTDKVLFRLKLPPDSAALWSRFAPKVRNQVRKAEKSGLEVERGGAALAGAFYDIYSQNMRRLGSPPHSRKFFDAVLEAFSGATRIHVVRFGERAVAAGLTMENGDSLEIPWASSLAQYGRLCVNHLMYWRIIEDACRRGFRWFHFGRSSRGTGSYHFKKQWGCEAATLYWYRLSANSRNATPGELQQTYRWATRIWRRLPLWVVRRAGPRIVAKVP